MDKDEKKHCIAELWRTCFHDSKAFVDFYFSEKYKDENAMTVIENGQVLSALQMIPYTSTCWGKTFPVSYIAGASTHPDVQGRGVMSGLLRSSFGEMFKRGIAFSVLIPAEMWLFKYYSRFGYASVYFENNVRFHIPVTKKWSEKDSEELPLSLLYEYFYRKQLLNSCCILHDWDDFRAIVKDIESEGGAVIAESQGNRVTALAFALYDGSRVFIPEWMYDDESSKKVLLEKCSDYFGCSNVLCRSVSDKEGKAYGMARIIRVEDMLTIWAALHPECSCSLSVTDEIISENNALFVIGEGTCRKQSLISGMEAMDINTLSSLLLMGENKNGNGCCPFPRQQPSMSLMFS